MRSARSPASTIRSAAGRRAAHAHDRILQCQRVAGRPHVAGYDATGGRMYAVNSYGPAFYDHGQAVVPKSASQESEPDDIGLGCTTLAVLSSDGSLRAAQLSAGGGSLSALGQPLARHLPAQLRDRGRQRRHDLGSRGGKLSGYPKGGGAPRVSAIPLSPRPTPCKSPRSATSPSSPIRRPAPRCCTCPTANRRSDCVPGTPRPSSNCSSPRPRATW